MYMLRDWQKEKCDEIDLIELPITSDSLEVTLKNMEISLNLLDKTFSHSIFNHTLDNAENHIKKTFDELTHMHEQLKAFIEYKNNMIRIEK